MLPVTPAGMRIGELADRLGVSTHALRAWEKRYGLLRPSRSAKGYRLYGPQDEARVREMLRWRGLGVTAVQAAALVLGAERVAGTPSGAGEGALATASPEAVAELTARLRAALDRYDEAAGQAVLDELFTALSVEAAIEQVLMPYLAEVGERWASGEIDVAQEHFASQVLRSRLSVLAVTWGVGSGPVALLASPPGERHDLSLLAFGVVLGRAGWQVRFLGADTPLDDLLAAARRTTPDLVVISSVIREPLEACADELGRLRLPGRLVLAGPGASPALARRARAELMVGDPVTAARHVSATGTA